MFAGCPAIRCTAASLFFFFNDTAPTEISTLSLHDALPILLGGGQKEVKVSMVRTDPFNNTLPQAVGPAHQARHLETALSPRERGGGQGEGSRVFPSRDRKSTRLNSSH